MEVARSKKGIAISGRKSVTDLLNETGTSDRRPIETPIDPNQKVKMTKVIKGIHQGAKTSWKANLLITYMT